MHTNDSPGSKKLMNGSKKYLEIYTNKSIYIIDALKAFFVLKNASLNNRNLQFSEMP